MGRGEETNDKTNSVNILKLIRCMLACYNGKELEEALNTFSGGPGDGRQQDGDQQHTLQRKLG